jgi:hypothetical protein
MQAQLLTLRLEGITTGDYLAYVRDPEPQALGLDLRSVTVQGDPLGDTVEALLCWRSSPPDALAAAPIAGLPLTAEVVSVTSPPQRRSSEGRPLEASLHHGAAPIHVEHPQVVAAGTGGPRTTCSSPMASPRGARREAA